MLEAVHNAFLKHDSYVELTELHFFAESELRQARRLGHLTPSEARKLALAANEAATLSRERQELIWEQLGSL